MPSKKKPRLTNEDSFRGDAMCENCHHSTSKNEHGPDHESTLGYCIACTECNPSEPVAEGEQAKEKVTPQSRHYLTPPTGGTRATERNHTMSTIDPSEWNLEDSQEPYALKDGTEALLRVIEVRKLTRDDGDTEYYVVRLEVPTEPFSKEITDFLDIPSRGLNAKRLNAARQKMLNFSQSFGFDMSRPFDPSEDWVGLEGWCILSLAKSDLYGEQNRISKYLRAR